MFPIPWIAILAATIASFFLGALWYSPVLFGRVWMRETGVDEEACRHGSNFRVLGTTFVLTLISTSVLSFCLSPRPGVLYGAIAGLVIGIGWVATSIGTNFLFEGRSFKLFAITGGYHVVRFLVAGIILGLLQ
jgi:hypothetical protein